MERVGEVAVALGRGGLVVGGAVTLDEGLVGVAEQVEQFPPRPASFPVGHGR